MRIVFSSLVFIILLNFFVIGQTKPVYALTFSETAFGDSDGYGLDAILFGESIFISSFNRITGDLRFSEKIAGSWNTISIDTNVVDILFPAEAETSIVMDSNGNPHIFYHHDYQNELKHAWRNNGNWQIETLDTDGTTGGFPEAIACGNNQYCVCYQDLTNQDLRFSMGSAGSWNTETIDNSANSVGAYCDIIKKDNGDIVVAYLDATTKNAKIATGTLGDWEITSLNDGFTEFGMWNSLAKSSDESLYIISSGVKNSDSGESDRGAYISTLPSGGSWTTQTLESGFVGGHPSLYIDQNDNQLIAYRYLRFSALFGHASAISFSTIGSDSSYTRDNIDGNVFCLGTFLFNRVLRSQNGKTHVIYHRSFGPCGDNASEIVIKSADPDPTPTPTATPTQTATSTATATPTQQANTPTATATTTSAPVQETPSPLPNSNLNYQVNFSKSKGTFLANINFDKQSADSCNLKVEFSQLENFANSQEYNLSIEDQSSIKLQARISRLILKKKNQPTKIYSRASLICQSEQKITSEINTFTPKSTNNKGIGISSKNWTKILIKSLRVGL